MKIDDVYTHLSLLNQTTEVSGVKRSEEREESAPELRDQASGTKVDLSTTSVEFSKAAEMIDQESTERTEKVNEIKLRILSDDYEVDSGRVADKILKESLLDFVKS